MRWSTLFACLLGGLLGCLAACGGEPTPLPTEAAVAELDRSLEPPLYQLLYDAPLLPDLQQDAAKVRLLIWLRHMQLSAEQLQRLAGLRATAIERTARLDAAEAQVTSRYAGEESRVYAELWQAMARGAPIDAPEMADLTEQLRELRAGGARERELLTLRLEGIRSILDAEQEFLRSLSPRQEALLADALFFLRHRLDPVANPGDFRALAGSVYEQGQYAILTRGTGDVAGENLNIGALWSEAPGIQAHELHEARREVILFLALLEPGLEEAVAAALPLAGVPAGGGASSSAPPPPPPSQPPAP